MVCGGRLGWPLRLRCVETVRRSSGEMCRDTCGLFRAHLNHRDQVSPQGTNGREFRLE